MPPKTLAISEHDLELGLIQGWFEIARIEDNRPVYVREHAAASYLQYEELEILVEDNVHWEAYFTGAELYGGDEFVAEVDLEDRHEDRGAAPDGTLFRIPRQVLRTLLHENWARVGVVPILYRVTQRALIEFEGCPYIFRAGDLVQLEGAGPHPSTDLVSHGHYLWLVANTMIDSQGAAFMQAQSAFVTRNTNHRWFVVSEGSVVLTAAEETSMSDIPEEATPASLGEFLELAERYDLSSEQMELIEAVLTTPELVRVIEPPPVAPSEPAVVGPSSWERLLDEPLV